MLSVPSQLLERFDKYFQSQKTPNNLQWAYKKWLRYYLDFCSKYKYPPAHQASLPNFIKKLKEKKQSKQQQEEAVTAINIYYRLLETSVSMRKEPPLQSQSPPIYIRSKQEKTLSVHEPASKPIQKQNIIASYHGEIKPDEKKEKEHAAEPTGASWKLEYSRLEVEIRVRHYSLKTLRT